MVMFAARRFAGTRAGGAVILCGLLAAGDVGRPVRAGWLWSPGRAGLLVPGSVFGGGQYLLAERFPWLGADAAGCPRQQGSPLVPGGAGASWGASPADPRCPPPLCPGGPRLLHRPPGRVRRFAACAHVRARARTRAPLHVRGGRGLA